MRLRIRDDDLRFARNRPLCRGDLWVGDFLASVLGDPDAGHWQNRRQWLKFMYGEFTPFRNRIPRVPGSAPRSTP